MKNSATKQIVKIKFQNLIKFINALKDFKNDSSPPYTANNMYIKRKSMISIPKPSTYDVYTNWVCKISFSRICVERIVLGIMIGRDRFKISLKFKYGLFLM